MPLTLRLDVTVRRPLAAVWRHLEHPVQHGRWNPKIRDTAMLTDGAPRRGSRYRVTTDWRGRTDTLDGEIVEFDPPHALTFRLSGGSLPPNAFAMERYQLTAMGTGTLVRQTVTFEDPRIGWILRLIVRLVTRSGWSAERSYLLRFRDVVEQS